MDHLPYPKIPAVLAGAHAAGPWIATEKVHGAQLVIAHDGAALRVGKRKAWLRDDEPFFGWQLLRPALERTARAALRLGGPVVRLYGELYGGHYPHPDVPAVPGASAVQTGVWYAPDIRFALFDVLLGDPGVLCPYAEIAGLAAAGGVDVVPLLARGPRREVDAVPVRFATRVPALHGLPELDGNLAEGVVLRPDARLPLAGRPIVKHKIAEFDETRFGESRPWSPHVAAADVPALAAALVNPPRVASARSKAGPDDPAALEDEIVLDVLVDLLDAFPGLRSRAGLEDLVRAVVRASPVARFGDSRR
ncbi:RNA ligase family protein [Dactylosporangium salmoneum]|uniref:RNA ligase domain-containing protein n=1 Tax=Dactylosporangium salmoneum TaxID=53361 RepID=A0ABN3FVQ6_9ACTN